MRSSAKSQVSLSAAVASAIRTIRINDRGNGDARGRIWPEVSSDAWPASLKVASGDPSLGAAPAAAKTELVAS